MRIGLIVRSDKSGLGVQSKRLTRLLNPSKLMVIDSSYFNGNQQYKHEWYKDYDTLDINGFPTDMQISTFLRNLDVVITCETFYSGRFTSLARMMRVKTVIIANPEFYDYFSPRFRFVTTPDLVIVPSLWKIELMKQEWNAIYIPTPIFEDELKEACQTNIEATGRKFLFMNGKTADKDRNGLNSLYEALHHAKGDFTVTVKAQHDIKKHPDPRIIYDFTNPYDQNDLYKGFDCLIQPRRYGGQTLSMTEALTCAMPVIMTDIDPNNKVLPKEWLVDAKPIDKLKTRIELDVYDADPKQLAHLLDTIDLSKKSKLKALELSQEYNVDKVKDKFNQALNRWLQ